MERLLSNRIADLDKCLKVSLASASKTCTDTFLHQATRQVILAISAHLEKHSSLMLYNGTLQTTAFEIEDGRIRAIYKIRNRDKLAHMSGHIGAIH